jgi:5-methylcytosine-specific restriction endonuclease McrA
MTNEEYKKLLQHPKWQEMAASVKKRDGWRCTRCGTKGDENNPMHVHHTQYATNRPPWEVDPDTLLTMCKKCHTRTCDQKTAIRLLGEELIEQDIDPEKIDLLKVHARSRLKYLWDRG